MDSVNTTTDLREGNCSFPISLELKGDNCPAYIIGKYETSPFVMFGINPGYSRKNNPVEDMEARKSWDDYQNLNLNFFRFFSGHKFESPYYTALGHLLAA